MLEFLSLSFYYFRHTQQFSVWAIPRIRNSILPESGCFVDWNNWVLEC